MPATNVAHYTVVRLRARLGLRDHERTERWLRLFAWGHNAALIPPSSDPCATVYGLYCVAPHQDPRWLDAPKLNHGRNMRPLDSAVTPWAREVIVPWAEQLLSIGIDISLLAARHGPLTRLTWDIDAELALLPSSGIVLRAGRVLLRETPGPGRHLLRANLNRYHTTAGDRYKLAPSGAARTERGGYWASRHDTPEWTDCRATLIGSFGRPLLDLLAALEQRR